jgi:hypothetical protein
MRPARIGSVGQRDSAKAPRKFGTRRSISPTMSPKHTMNRGAAETARPVANERTHLPMTSKTIPEPSLESQLARERQKRVELCEALMFCAGVDHNGLDDCRDFLKRLCTVAADDLDTLAAALAGAGGDNPKTPDFVSRLADRLRHGEAMEVQVRELLNEVRELRGAEGSNDA